MSDVVEMLKGYCVCDDGYPEQCPPCAAIDELEQLSAENERLRGSLLDDLDKLEAKTNARLDALEESIGPCPLADDEIERLSFKLAEAERVIGAVRSFFKDDDWRRFDEMEEALRTYDAAKGGER